jgi:hypothetical protein
MLYSSLTNAELVQGTVARHLSPLVSTGSP